jgi:hypothetical protein
MATVFYFVSVPVLERVAVPEAGIVLVAGKLLPKRTAARDFYL